jgi:hypothetical protein
MHGKLRELKKRRGRRPSNSGAPSSRHLKTVDCHKIKARITAPTEKQKIALIGVMLGGCGIRSTPDVDSYISALSWMLDDCPINRDIELYLGRKRWMPLPAIAATVRKVWTNRREDYGRPIPIAEFIDECGRHSSLLLYERSRIETFGRMHCSLSAIVKATEDAEPPDDDEAVPL